MLIIFTDQRFCKSTKLNVHYKYRLNMAFYNSVSIDHNFGIILNQYEFRPGPLQTDWNSQTGCHLR
jgi:hypothetical protein